MVNHGEYQWIINGNGQLMINIGHQMSDFPHHIIWVFLTMGGSPKSFNVSHFLNNKPSIILGISPIIAYNLLIINHIINH